MKALGIAVICAQTGIPVAATKFRITPYKSIFTRILGNDNLWASLSSFAVEMTEFRSILKYADKNSLILGDELCSGTETQSATAIVSAGIQILHKRGAQFLFATHLHEISELEEIRRLPGIEFAHLGIEFLPNSKQIVYKRTLERGAGSSLYGLEVCHGLDMDEEFLQIATNSRKFLNSRYNSQVAVRRCELCGSTKDLESHHIQEQNSAKNGFVAPGTAVHRASNLTVLCGHCHKEHHGGRIEIQGWKDTSTGRELGWTRSPKVDMADQVKDRLRILVSKKTKEKDMIAILAAEYDCTVTVSELRIWKKQL
jgi:DNA mismatch repair protein MutS